MPIVKPSHFALGGALHRRQHADAVRAVGARPGRTASRTPCRCGSMKRVTCTVFEWVNVGERREIRDQLALVADVAEVGPRIVEVLVEDEHVRDDPDCQSARRDQVRPGRRRHAEAVEHAVAIERLAAGAVGRSRARQAQTRDARVEDAGAGANAPACHRCPDPTRGQGAAATCSCPTESCRRTGNGRSCRGTPAIEQLIARRDHVGLMLRLPADAVRDRQVAGRLPFVLDEERRLDLRDRLRARLFDRSGRRRQPAAETAAAGR